MPNKKAKTNTSAPPRTRPGKAFPGGRRMRRALAKLARRRKDYPTKTGYHMPGSMKG